MNDNDSTTGVTLPPLPDAHGQAALMLVESLIHGLCDNSTLSTGEAIEVADRAILVQRERAEAADGAGAPMWQAHTLLVSIATSLRIDEKSATHAPGPAPGASWSVPPDEAN